ncbi:MAG TPA: TlpA disulfide reductase family protein, partial [Chloroflexota bacterium]|nr:TlpA disulfide reductase family protein [Chloroflexota bacterium]
GSRKALVDFGVPAELASPLGLLLPLAELAVAVSLVPTATAWWGAVGALALLLLFMGGIGINLARGRRPDCRCFGQLHSAPVGWPTFVRNAVLAAVASFIVWQGWENPGPSMVGWVADLTTGERISLVVGLVVLGLLGIEASILVQLLGQNGRLLLRVEALEAKLGGGAPAAQAGLPLGALAPGFRLPGLDGEERALDDLRAPGKPVLLVFSDPNCGPCNALLPEIGRWQREHDEQATIALVSRGAPGANWAKAAEHGLSQVLLQREYEVVEAYRAYGTPSAVLVRPDGTIGSPVAGGADAIRSLVAHAVGPQSAQPWVAPSPVPTVNGHGHDHGHDPGIRPVALKPGEPAPGIKLPDLEGRTVDLVDFRGSKTLLLFWNPGCSFCQELLPELKAWEAKPPKGAPRLLVVSTGTIEANRAQGLRSPIVLDQDLATVRGYGAEGTPSAVLVDAQGKIASHLAVGVPAVLALARARRGQPARGLLAREFGRR